MNAEANSSDSTENQAARSWRLLLLFGLLALIASAILFKLLSLYVQDQDFLQSQGMPGHCAPP
ncbi:hypothetical protein [Marinobacterium aestuariivivens]|uniref:Uncharacterized protein n=1 Tax=Marinobacterium aestuariivivens TaxID=1698799 RepID=A0ABW1ZWK2_9GAMM